uniref:ATP synthase F0 subunit 8 n=1 Tax=Kroppcarcinus siderastreicola TaxID=1903112 RepID=UPI0028D8E2E6|nr:ATP synthase F0 subunit 8 [Kroppcarcinus siderastreicola]WMY25229.1 ATP synthase F0 subunit 8 [Kroppcarcinus siderastreicola]
MPQMAPIYWLFLFIFFIASLLLFFLFNYYVKPFEKMMISHSIVKNNTKYWKL